MIKCMHFHCVSIHNCYAAQGEIGKWPLRQCKKSTSSGMPVHGNKITSRWFPVGVGSESLGPNFNNCDLLAFFKKRKYRQFPSCCWKSFHEYQFLDNVGYFGIILIVFYLNTGRGNGRRIIRMLGKVLDMHGYHYSMT